jgi:hypothetical protein
MGQNDKFFQDTQELTAATPATVSLTSAKNRLILSLNADETVYLKFNWETGDDEVAADNFDACMYGKGDRIDLGKHPPDTAFPNLSNIRVLASGNCALGLMGW